MFASLIAWSQKTAVSVERWVSQWGLRTLIVIAVSFFVWSRFWQLGTFPAFYSHDELPYALTAKSLALTGRGWSGEWSPWSLTPFEEAYAELSAVLIAPAAFLPGSDHFKFRIPSVVMSAVIVGSIGVIAADLIKNRRVGVIAGALSVFNPWIWQFSRLTFDGYFSMGSILLATAVFLKTKGWYRLLAFPLFFVSFYQYQGYKLLFLPWVILFGVWLIMEETEILKGKWRQALSFKTWPILAVMLACTAMFGYYALYQLPQQASSERLETIILPESKAIGDMVDVHRRIALTNPLTPIFINKYTLWMSHVSGRYAHVYAPRYLFWEGQGGPAAFSAWRFGSLYWIDLFLVIIGLAWVWSNQRRAFFLLLGAFAVVPLPALLAKSDWITFRSSLVVPLMIILAALGLHAMLQQRWHKLLGVVAVLYLACVGIFSFHYFVRYPVYSAEHHYFADRILASYLDRVPQDQPVTVYTEYPKYSFGAHVLSNELFTAETASQIQEAYRTENYAFGNVRFLQECFDNEQVLETNEIIIVDSEISECSDDGDPQDLTATETEDEQEPVDLPYVSLLAIKDSGVVYRIYSDKVCQGVELPDYLRIQSKAQIEFSQLSTQEFCESWVADIPPMGSDGNL